MSPRITKVRTSHPLPDGPSLSLLGAAASMLGESVGDAAGVVAGEGEALVVAPEVADGDAGSVGDGEGLAVSWFSAISVTRPVAGSQRKSVYSRLPASIR